MRCPSCAAENREGRSFCARCGQPLKLVYASCGASAGIRITPERTDASTAADGERKAITALFADIKGSTEMVRDLDPEEARAIVDPVLQLMMAAVHRYGLRCAIDRRRHLRTPFLARQQTAANGSNGRLSCQMESFSGPAEHLGASGKTRKDERF
jgi:class 3 adenylate cyclase